MIRFGPSGNSGSFYAQGNKSSVQMPRWLYDMGLDAYEYSCTKGVRLKDDKARQLRAEAEKYDIRLSVHAPYYINLASAEPKKQEKSIRYILDSMRIAQVMGASRVVVHAGACGTITRSEALDFAKETLKRAIHAADESRFGDIHICPETMGKMNQLGTLEEVLALCSVDERLIPTVDFGHLYARSQGETDNKKSVAKMLFLIENALGLDRLKRFHIHFSKVEYSAGGEKRHMTFQDTHCGPTFDILGELIYQKGLSPVVICESAGTMAEDSLVMKGIYEKIAGNNK